MHIKVKALRDLKNFLIQKYSFEPQVKQFKILKKLKSDKIYLNNCGIGSKNENKNIFINSETAASSYLNLKNEENYFRNIKTINKEQTVLKTIDYLNEKKLFLLI